MNIRYRNPFKIRASEKLESESNFLRMYSPYVLDALVDKNKDSKLWNNVLFLRSSPGAGKTSILKIFEPNNLLTLSYNHSAPYYKDIIDYLKDLQILTDTGTIHLTGVYLSCTRNYQVLEDLDIGEAQKKGLFFALINARVVLSSLKCFASLYNQNGLDDIEIRVSNFDYSYLDINFPCTAQQLFSWASQVERGVLRAIDSFLPITESVEGHSELFAFGLMSCGNIFVKGREVDSKILFMFDDAHKFSKKQRKHFFEYITVIRQNYNIWIAERLEALDDHINVNGASINRDYNEINLEEIWQKSNKFKNIVANIAEKRASMSSEDLNSFQGFLEDNIREPEYEDKFLIAFEKSIDNITKISEYHNSFRSWIEYLLTKCEGMTNYQKSIFARQAEIIVHRHLGKNQLTIDFDLSPRELQGKLSSELALTAGYFISIENKIPYFFGFDNLVKMSSNNIEQFLSFSAELYELMLSRKIADQSINLVASDQEKLFKRISDSKWKELNRTIPQSDSVLRFLQNLAVFSEKETNKPSAPYAPGVNGFAIREPVFNKFTDRQEWQDDKSYSQLLKVLSTCVSFNLLEKRLTKQGKENQQWTVYYLNRWLCVRFNLPLSYGGWRPKTPAELLKWTKIK